MVTSIYMDQDMKAEPRKIIASFSDFFLTERQVLYVTE